MQGALAAPLRELPSAELFSAAKKVGELMDHPGWAFLEQLMEGRKAKIVTQMVHGPVPERHEFAALTSMLSGIDQVLLAGHVIRALAAEKERELEEAQSAGEAGS